MSVPVDQEPLEVGPVVNQAGVIPRVNLRRVALLTLSSWRRIVERSKKLQVFSFLGLNMNI